MSFLNAVKGAAPPGERNYFNSGDYIAELLTLTAQESKNPTKKGHKQIVARFRIVEVLAELAADVNFAASNRTGEIVSTIMDLDGPYPEMEQGKLNNLLTALVGPDWADQSDAIEAAMVPPGTAFAGSRLRATAQRMTTARSKKHITPVMFAALP